MSYSNNFDFAAFLNSPSNGIVAGGDVQFGPATHTAMSNELVDTLDNVDSLVDFGMSADPSAILPEWASSTASMHESSSSSHVNGETQSETGTGTDSTTATSAPTTTSANSSIDSSYRARIAAHHTAQLRHWMPQLGGAAGGASAGLGGAGQRSFGGSHSSPSVPLSQAAKAASIGSRPKMASELTIQERRRLSRRGQAAGHGVINPKVSGRHQKRAMSKLSESQAIAPSEQSQLPVRSDQQQQQQQQQDQQLPNPEPVPTFGAMFPSQSYIGQQSLAEPHIYNGQFGDIEALSKRAYATTGFDLIGCLMRVATRPNPKITIGPVDLSCSFTVVDAKHPDQPIVHCSDTFCALTGYDRSEVIGRNCRFLQSPYGNVDVGSERMHTDNGAVSHIKKHCSRFQECQTSLINYRRDGTPFINLVTIVPIGWGDSEEPVFLVGFQVDLVEQPGAVLERKPNGLYVVNYSQQKADQGSALIAAGETPVTKEEDREVQDPVEVEASKRAVMAQELANIISSGSDETHKWARLLLDNSHDLIHVLSLKGTFLYVSPSVERLLGYKAEELVGRSISEFCHPSDLVPVFRELKDSTSNASIAAAARQWARHDGTVNPPTKGGAGQTGPQVNLVMRMRHKHHGHSWIENSGKLHLEQGKGRKVVISSGRLRPVYNLPWEQARRTLDSREAGFWSKVSTKGLVISTNGSVGDVVDRGDLSKRNGGVDISGRNICEVTNAEAHGPLLQALGGNEVNVVTHALLGRPVSTTFIPSSSPKGPAEMPFVFAFTQKINPTLVNMAPNLVQPTSDAAMSNSESVVGKAGEPSTGSVFAELSTQRSSSWVFELHQLKNANKRLREQVRAHQRRLSGGRPTINTAMPPPSPMRTKSQSHASAVGNGLRSNNARFLVEASPLHMSAGGHISDSSATATSSGYGSGSGSGSGSATDDTQATSIVGEPPFSDYK